MNVEETFTGTNIVDELNDLTGSVIATPEQQFKDQQMMEYMRVNGLDRPAFGNRSQRRNYYLKADLGGDKSNVARATEKKQAKVRAKNKQAKKARKRK